MSRVDEILAAAAQLGPSELSDLRQQIERMERRANAILLDTKRGMTFRLCRLRDGEFVELRRRSLAIEEDYGFYVQLHFSLLQRGEELNFAQAYLTLKHLCGESRRYLDDYKTAFSFPFALDVIKDGREYPYLLEIRNFRDSLYFTLRKPVSPDDERLKDLVYQPPFADEFSREEIHYFISYFYGYLMGRWDVLCSQPHEPFVRSVPSNLILFGYCNGIAFENNYDALEDFDRDFQRYQLQVEQEKKTIGNGADPCAVVEDPA